MRSISHCRPGSRCRKWRECAYCARVRQAQIANVATAGAEISNNITYAVVRSGSPQTIKKDKAAVIKGLEDQAHGGLWTIESGAVHGLHLNLVLGSDNEITANDIAQHWRTDADIWAATIPASDVRNVAAYSAKMSGFPAKSEYSGHLYGSFGSWKLPLRLLASQDAAHRNPMGHAIALNYQLEQRGVTAPAFNEPAPEFSPPHIEHGPMDRSRETDEERQGRIERNIQREEEAKAQHERERQKWATRKHLKTLFSAYVGEADTKGVAYVDGYGIATRGDFVALGLLEGSTAGAREDWQE